MDRLSHAAPFSGLPLYAAVARMSFRRQSTYRGAMLAGMFTNTVFGVIRAAVLRSAIAQSSVGGLTKTSVTAFVFVSQAMIAVTMLFGDFGLIALVKSGDVATELHRPWDWSMYRLSSDLGRSAFNLITRGLSIAALGWLIYRLRLPSGQAFVSFVLVALLAAVLASRIWTIGGLSSFWLIDATGVVQLIVSIATLSTGLLVPLQILPSSLRAVFHVLPFSGLIQGPVDVLLGLQSVGRVALHQVAWIIVFEILLRAQLKAATHKLELQGG
jgi:ABC-2 type transport system permease protein